MADSVSNSDVVFIGGGGHAKVMLDAGQCAGGVEILGFVDDDGHAPILEMQGCPAYLGSLDQIANSTNDAKWRMIFAVGDLALRAGLLERLIGADFAGAIVHPSAVVSASASVETGAFVSAGAILNAHAVVSAHAIVNTGAIVEHDCRVGINAHIGPGAVLGGGVVVGDHTLVGIGAAVLPGIRIGSGAIVGGGAVVTRDVGNGERVVGVPARVVVGV